MNSDSFAPLGQLAREALASRRALVGGCVLVCMARPAEQANAKRHRLRSAGGCIATWDGNQALNLADFERAGQAFIATRSGKVRQVTVVAVPLDPSATLVLQLVRATDGIPSNAPDDVLAVAAAQPSAVVGNPGVLTVRFTRPRLTRGDEYAVVISQPGPIGMNVPIQPGAGCDHAALVSDGSGPFQSTGLDGRMLIRVWVA